MTGNLPSLLDPRALPARLDDPRVRVIDLGPAEQFAAGHIPGSLHLPYAEIVEQRPPVAGLLPAHERLQALCGRLGIGPDTHVVALDAEGGGAAGRLLWTLDALGHRNGSLLDGGLQAWHAEGLPLTRETTPEPAPAEPWPLRDGAAVADATRILERLGDDDFRLLDARSAEEYDGSRVRAARGGHIPGARHYEWTRAMDRRHHLRLRPAEDLLGELAALDIAPEHEVVVYCHSHHRSAFSYWMLRVLGFQRVRGYPGSWSDWGNRTDTPVETGPAPG